MTFNPWWLVHRERYGLTVHFLGKISRVRAQKSKLIHDTRLVDVHRYIKKNYRPHSNDEFNLV